MARKYSLRYLPIAVDDLIAIFDWIAADSAKNAASFLEKLDHQMSALRGHPLLGRIPRDDKLKNAGYRVLIIESYLVFYQVHHKAVEIHRVIHGSRNLDNLI